eukprot:s2645_g6.t1
MAVPRDRVFIRNLVFAASERMIRDLVAATWKEFEHEPYVFCLRDCVARGGCTVVGCTDEWVESEGEAGNTEALKEKQTPKPKAVNKKPAASMSDGATEKEAAPSMNMTIDNLKAGVMEPEARDKGKAQKYAKDSDHLPEYVKSLMDEKSQAINRLYSRQGDGTLKLNLQDPLFQEASTMYERNYSSTMDDAYPRSIMINMFFRGDQAAFDEALRDGDIL